MDLQMGNFNPFIINELFRRERIERIMQYLENIAGHCIISLKTNSTYSLVIWLDLILVDESSEKLSFCLILFGPFSPPFYSGGFPPLLLRSPFWFFGTIFSPFTP